MAFIRDLMLANDWRADLAQLLAPIWGVTDTRVRHLSAEASRLIRNRENKSYVRAKLLDRLDESFDVARSASRRSPTNASEAMTRAVLASAQIAGVSTPDKGGPGIVINVGAVSVSPVLGDLYGEPEPRVIDVQPEPVEAGELPSRIHDAPALPEDGSGRGEGVAKDSVEGPENWRLALGGG